MASGHLGFGSTNDQNFDLSCPGRTSALDRRTHKLKKTSTALCTPQGERTTENANRNRRTAWRFQN